MARFIQSRVKEELMRKLFFYLIVVVILVMMLQANLSAFPANGKNANHYILMYQTNSYDSKIGDSVNYFFQKILRSQDSILLFTPMRPINYSPKSRQSQPLKVLVSRTIDILKKDTSVNAATYRNIQDSMLNIVNEISSSLGTSKTSGLGGGSNASIDIKNLLTQYLQLLNNYRQQRKTNDTLFLKLSEMIKKLEGEKHITIVYQQDMRIIPDKDTMGVLRENSRWAFQASECFYDENTKSVLDVEKVSNALKETGITLNLIYIKANTSRRIGYEYRELSGDMYESLSNVAKATGGEVITTSKPEEAFKNIFK